MKCEMFVVAVVVVVVAAAAVIDVVEPAVAAADCFRYWRRVCSLPLYGKEA